MKKYYDTWTGEEINDYIDQFNVLVLFQEVPFEREARIVIYGKVDDEQKEQLQERILKMFGGRDLNDKICNKVNELAEKWYNKVILNKRARVVNFSGNG